MCSPHRDCLYVFDEIMLTGGATTWDFAEEVTNRYGVERRIIACPDPTGVPEKHQESGSTDHTILRRSGFTVSSPKAPWKVRDKVTAINTALYDAMGERRTSDPPTLQRTNKSPYEP